MKSICLIYHDLYEGGPEDLSPHSATIYHTSLENFKQHLKLLKSLDINVVTASSSINNQVSRSVSITFDDGWHGAFKYGIPALLEFGWCATFFVTSDFIGRISFVDRSMLIQASKLGMEIGVHGTTHRMMSACTKNEILYEFSKCKSILEEIVQRPITIASMPGGDWSRSIAICAKKAGIEQLFTSHPGINTPKTDKFHLRRISIKQSTTGKIFLNYINGKISKEQVRYYFLRLPKLILGMKSYAKIRRYILDRPRDDQSQIFTP